MKPLLYLSPLFFLGSCKALEQMDGTPLDPADPTGPTQLDNLLGGVATTATSFGPVGWIVAAMLGAGAAAYKAKGKS